MSTLKTNHCDWDKNTRREMTLDEFVGQLPIGHCARKEFKALQAKIARLKKKIKQWVCGVCEINEESECDHKTCEVFKTLKERQGE